MDWGSLIGGIGQAVGGTLNGVGSIISATNGPPVYSPSTNYFMQGAGTQPSNTGANVPWMALTTVVVLLILIAIAIYIAKK